MFSLFSSKAHGEPVVLLHIGSASVSVALAEVGEKKPTFFYTARDLIPFQEKFSFTRFSDAVFSAVESLLQKVTTEGVATYTKERGRPPRIRRVGLVLSSTWCVSKTLSITISKERPFQITTGLVRNVSASARDSFEQEIERGKYPHIGADAVVLEESLIDVALNGYSITNPFGRSASELRISLLVSLMSASFSDRIFKTIDRALPDYSLHPHSYSLTMFSIVRDFFPTVHTFLLVDVDGEVTDVALVQDDVLVESISFPSGTFSVLRCLGEDAGSVEVRARLLEREGSKRALEAREKWLSQYKKALESLAERYAIPNRLYISGNADMLSWFVEILGGYEGGDALFAKPHSITPLTNTSFLPLILLSGDAHYEAHLSMLLLLFNKATRSGKIP